MLATDSYCPAYFDRIVCWPPTQAGVRQLIPCPKHMFPNANPDAFASRLCTNQSQWEERSHYELCIGCRPNDTFYSVIIVTLNKYSLIDFSFPCRIIQIYFPFHQNIFLREDIL